MTFVQEAVELAVQDALMTILRKCHNSHGSAMETVLRTGASQIWRH